MGEDRAIRAKVEDEEVIRVKRLYLSAAIILFFAAAVVAAPRYVASRSREPFHVTSCASAQKIAPANAVYYETREAAIQDGHRPCKICKP